MRELHDRALDILGRTKADVLLDRTSLIYFGDMAKLEKCGYTQDYHPREHKLALGAALLPPPYDVLSVAWSKS